MLGVDGGYVDAVVAARALSVGVNYVLHAAESGVPLPDRPTLFAKLPSALAGDGAEVRKHAITDELDYEGELALVISRRASRVSRHEALDHVAGYTIMNDVSARDLQRLEPHWIRAKSLDTFAPLGPAMVTTDSRLGSEPDDAQPPQRAPAMTEGGWRVALPHGAEPPYRVFVNAVQQREGEDFEVVGDELVFNRPLEKERIGMGRWTAMFLGLWGSYGKNDSVDVHYNLAGRQAVATSLDIIPPAAGRKP